MKSVILFLCCAISTVANAQLSMTVSAAPSATASQSIPVGGTYQFTATCQYTTNGAVNTAPCPALTWKTTSTTDSSISPSGLLTAKAPGTVNITATAGTVTSNSVAITITSSATLTSITLSAKTPIKQGTTEYLTPTCHYSDGSTKTCAITTWSIKAANFWSLNINAYGMVTAMHSGGSNQFTATQGSVTSAPVTVTVQ